MERLSVMRRRWITAVVFCALLASTQVVAPPVSGAQGADFSEGSWEGYLGMDSNYVFDTDEGPVPVDYQALGDFDGRTFAGTFSGTWLVDVYSRSTIDGVVVEANAIGVGDFNGPTVDVELEVDSVTVTEPTIGMSLTFSADELPGASGGRLQVEGGDCNTVFGTWAVDFSDQSLQGEFTAIRRGRDADDDGIADARRANQRDLSTRGRGILTDIRSGTVDTAAIRSLLQDAEGALGSGPEERCGGGDDGSFRSATTQLIDSMLFELAGSDALDADTLIELMLAGARSGAFSRDAETSDFWYRRYGEGVDAAVASGDRVTLVRFSAASRILGREAEAQAIDDLLFELGS